MLVLNGNKNDMREQSLPVQGEFRFRCQKYCAKEVNSSVTEWYPYTKIAGLAKQNVIRLI